jgi:hypothetical protein
MTRAEGLALIRRAGYLNNFKTLIEVRIKARISHDVALKEFNIGRDCYKKDKEDFEFDAQFNAGVLSND